jgi:prepilin-type processing-associated H-X9-DG protein
LAVIAILCLLAGLVLPVFGTAQEMAHSGICLSNLHAVAVAAHAYAADYRGNVPRGNRLYWYVAFLPYLPEGGTARDFRHVTIYKCPSYPEPRQTVCYVDSSWTFRSATDNYGYEINPPQPLQKIDSPRETIYLCDNEYGPWRPIITGRRDPEADRNDVWTPTHIASSNHEGHITYSRRCAKARHWDGLNVLYFDGHARWMRGRDMTVDMWRDKR